MKVVIDSNGNGDSIMTIENPSIAMLIALGSKHSINVGYYVELDEESLSRRRKSMELIERFHSDDKIKFYRKQIDDLSERHLSVKGIIIDGKFEFIKDDNDPVQIIIDKLEKELTEYIDKNYRSKLE